MQFEYLHLSAYPIFSFGQREKIPRMNCFPSGLTEYNNETLFEMKICTFLIVSPYFRTFVINLIAVAFKTEIELLMYVVNKKSYFKLKKTQFKVEV